MKIGQETFRCVISAERRKGQSVHEYAAPAEASQEKKKGPRRAKEMRDQEHMLACLLCVLSCVEIWNFIGACCEPASQHKSRLLPRSCSPSISPVSCCSLASRWARLHFETQHKSTGQLIAICCPVRKFHFEIDARTQPFRCLQHTPACLSSETCDNQRTQTQGLFGLEIDVNFGLTGHHTLPLCHSRLFRIIRIFTKITFDLPSVTSSITNIGGGSSWHRCIGPQTHLFDLVHHSGSPFSLDDSL